MLQSYTPTPAARTPSFTGGAATRRYARARRGGGGGGPPEGPAAIKPSASLLATLNGMFLEAADARAREAGRTLPTVEDYRGSMMAMKMLAQEAGISPGMVAGLGMVYGVALPTERAAPTTPAPTRGWPTAAVSPVNIGRPRGALGPTLLDIARGRPEPSAAPAARPSPRPARVLPRQVPVSGLSAGALSRAPAPGPYTGMLGRASGSYWRSLYGP